MPRELRNTSFPPHGNKVPNLFAIKDKLNTSEVVLKAL